MIPRNRLFFIAGIAVLAFAVLACRLTPSSALPVPSSTTRPAQTADPSPTSETGPKPGHWEGQAVFGADRLEISFDVQSASRIENVRVDYGPLGMDRCMFTVNHIALDASGGFNQELKAADLVQAIGLDGAMSGSFKDSTILEGKITLKMCGRTIYFIATDLPWTVKWVSAEVSVEQPEAPVATVPTLSSPPIAESTVPAPAATTDPGVTLEEAYLGDLKPVSYTLGYGTFSVGKYMFSSEDPADRIKLGDPIMLGGQPDPHAIFAHAPSRIVFKLERSYTALSALIGMVEWIDCGDGVSFTILVDGKEVYYRPEVKPNYGPIKLVAMINGGSELTLITDVGPNGNMDCDWAIWGNAVVR